MNVIVQSHRSVFRGHARQLAAIAGALVGLGGVPAVGQEQSLCLVQKLTPPLGTNDYYFGQDVAFDGDVAVVRAGSDDCPTGRCSAVYVFRRDDPGTPEDPSDDAWVNEQKLTFPDTQDQNALNNGRTSIRGDVIVAGARDACAAGANCGSAHVFRYSGGAWVEEQTLRPLEQLANQDFGKSVSVRGDVAVVGAATGADCGDGTLNCGYMQVYRHNGTEWIEEQQLVAASYAPASSFGQSVAMADDIVVVGHDNDLCPGGFRCGSAHVFRRNAITNEWERQTLTPSDATADDESDFGIRVAVSGNVVMVGAPFRDCQDPDLGGCGAVYAYTYDDVIEQWQEEILVPTDNAPGDFFGFPISMDGDVAYIGAHGGDCTEGNNCGKAYVFRNEGGAWVESQRLGTSNVAAVGGNFGAALACTPSGGIVGGFTAAPAGAAYVFQVVDLPECPCELALDPEIAQYDSNPSPSVALTDLRMNRYLGIRLPTSVRRSQAIEVEFVSLPPPWDIWNGTRMFVTDPTLECEAAGVGHGQTCPPGAATFAVSGLTCDFAQAGFRDWTTLPDGVVYVTHPGIVPQPMLNGIVPTYAIRAIDLTCNHNVEDYYSAGVNLQQVRWGDVVGGFDPSGPYYVAANGTVDVAVDVTAALNKFANRPGAPIKARVDVEPCALDGKINITDVTRILDGFRNLPFPFTPGGGFGCASADPCSYAAAALEASGLN